LPLVIGLSIALAVESVAVHALLYERFPLIDIVLLIGNALTIWWLVRQYRRIGDTPILVSDNAVLIRYGSIRANVPHRRIRDVTQLDWKHVPPDATTGFLKLSVGDDPNVLLTCDPPVKIALTLGISRTVSRFGLRIDEPAAFVKAVREASPSPDSEPAPVQRPSPT
jgi:hypothetical protein